jgi:hypothetical protein
MIGGNVVAHGGSVYVDYVSQHTPVAYWISAIGHLLGAEHFGGQRLFGFGVFALLLALLYLRNARVFGRIPLLVVVILVPMMHFYNPDLSYTVLSDNYQAIMGLFILFEVVAIGVFRDKSLHRWIVLGVASAFMFGVAFVSAYYIAGAVLTAAVLSVLNARPTLRGARPWTVYVLTRAGVFLAPFALLIGAIAATGALLDAFQQAYVLNRSYYSLYVAEGLGSDVLQPAYIGLWNIVTHLASLGDVYRLISPIAAIRELIGIGIILSTAVLFGRSRVVLGIGVLWMGSLTATRGWNGFHAQPLWMFVIGCLGLLIWCVIALLRTSEGHRVVLRIATALLGSVVVLAAVPYAVNAYLGRDTMFTPLVFPNPTRTSVITTLVPEGGKYAELGINNAYDFVVTRRLPAGAFPGVVPWFSDMMDDEMADRLLTDDPVLIFSDESNDVWGFNVIENAPALADVIREGYTRIDLSPIGIAEGVYIRNDALDESLQKLSREFSTELTVHQSATADG